MSTSSTASHGGRMDVGSSYAAMVMSSAGAEPTIEIRPLPQPCPDEAIVRVDAVSLNYHDLVNLMGAIPGPWPRVPMTDGAGEVVALGTKVANVSVGERVFGAFYPFWVDGELTRESIANTPGDACDGWLQQYVRFRADALVATPEHLVDVEAATLPCAGTTAWSALESAQITTGDTVVIQGTGGVAMYALMLAKERGATAIVTSSSDDKLDVAQQHGADHLVNRQRFPQWDREIRRITDRRGADLVIDLGGAETLDRSVGAVRMNGHVAVAGGLGGFGAASLPVATVMQRRIRLTGINVGSVAATRRLARAVSAARLHPHIGNAFDWTDLAHAIETQRGGKHTGKIVLTVDHGT
jgi:NADPH:quinone reductase-like Zn-dependent oxidoreductase